MNKAVKLTVKAIVAMMVGSVLTLGGILAWQSTYDRTVQSCVWSSGDMVWYCSHDTITVGHPGKRV